MKYSFLLPVCLASACLGEMPPAHIVQDLPPELDPRLWPAFVPPAHIVRDLNASETAEREAATAPLKRDALDSNLAAAVERYAAEEHVVEADMRAFFIDAKVAVPVQEKKDAPAATPGVAATPGNVTTLTCADGCYFDREQGVVVFMRDVKMRGEDMSLDCDNELKVFALRDESKKKDKKKGEEAKNEPELAQIDFNFDMKKPRLITASGNVVVNLKDKKGERVRATGDKMTYNGITGETILTGGNLSMTRGNFHTAVTGPDAFVRIYKDGNGYVKGKQVNVQATDVKAMQKKRDK